MKPKTLVEVLDVYSQYMTSYQSRMFSGIAVFAVGILIHTPVSLGIGIAAALLTFVIPIWVDILKDENGLYPEWFNRTVTWKNMLGTCTCVWFVHLFFACLRGQYIKAGIYGVLMLIGIFFTWMEHRMENRETTPQDLEDWT